MACCPVPGHDDNKPSMKVTESEGRFLFHCKVGCTYPNIAAALLARGVDVRDERPKSDFAPTAIWTICDPAGKPIAQHVRIDKPDGKIVYWQGPYGEKGGLTDRGLKLRDLPLYGSELLTSRPSESVVITEGEKAADAARKMGLLALGTTTGAEGLPSREALECLTRRTVYLWPDNDDIGRKHMSRLADALAGVAAKVETITWKDAPPKGDAADFTGAGLGRADFDTLIPKPKKTVLDDLKYMWQGVDDAIDDLNRFHAGDFSRYVRTGIATLDRKLFGGLKRGQVTLLGAPTGGAKSSLLASFAAFSASNNGGALLVSPEMGLMEIAEREIFRLSGVKKWHRNPWKTYAARDEAAKKHYDTAVRMATERAPCLVLDRPAVTLDEIETVALEAKRRHPNLALIAIDYAQEVADDDNAKLARYLAVGNVAVKGTELARNLDVAVVIASQVNVSKEPKSGRTEYSFRESQKLEHKAHNVLLFIVDWREDAEAETRTVERARFKAKKIRGGPVFEFDVTYEPEFFRVSDKDTIPAPPGVEIR